MRDILMFTMESCPYCKRARKWMSEVIREHPEYESIPLKLIDEVEEPKIADTYDYWYVPTYYVGGNKVHEGAATREIIERVFAEAYGDGN